MAQPDYRARAAAGIRALQRWYVRPAGRWVTTGWWNAANALTAVIRYMRYTGDLSHLEIIETTFAAAQLEHASFINGYFDDNGWWALAWVAAYDPLSSTYPLMKLACSSCAAANVVSRISRWDRSPV